MLPGLLGIAVLAMLTPAAGPARAATPPSPILVDTVVVTAGVISAGVELDGQLQAARLATVSAQTGGTVLALLVKAGDRVRAGQLLARVDDRSSSAGLAQSDAGVTQADTVARLARTQVTRQRALRAEGFISQAALDDAEAQLKAAEAGLAQAQAQAGRSQAVLAKGFAQVVAPFDGVVQATLVEAGDLAGPGRPLLTLFAPGVLRAVVQLPASQAAQWRARLNEARIGLPQPGAGGESALRWITPIRRELLPLADAVAQTMELRLDLAAADARELMPGLNVRVRFAPENSGAARAAPAGAKGTAAASQAQPAAERAGALRVPAAALLQRGELTAVYVALPAQPVFALRQVRVGPSEAGQWPVLAGLRAGERVAVDAVRAGLASALPR